MGKIREQLRKERKKKQILRASISVSLSIVVISLSAFLINILTEYVNTRPIVENTQTESEIIAIESESEVVVLPEESMQIVMVGDMLMHEKLLQTGKKDTGGYNFDHLFTNVKGIIADADLALVNQETIMGGSAFGYTGYPSFNTPNELIAAEELAGFDVLLFATNHAYDKGAKGVHNCMEYLDSEYPNLGYVGINHSEEDRENIFLYEKNGITIAVLNYTYGHNGVTLKKNLSYLINELDEDEVREDIRKAEEIADFTIVCPHWGTELKHTVDAKQEEWTNLFLEEGVDLVLGTHPHVIQPIEWKTHENGHQMLVYYSLGNFVNGTDSTGHGVTNRMVGIVADVNIEKDSETGNVEIVNYDAHPIVCHMADNTEYTVYFLDDYTEELASQNKVVQQDSEFSKSLCESIVNQVLGE